MSTRRTDPPFTVSVHAGFDENGIWVIDARLRFSEGFTSKSGSNVFGEGRLALLEGIACEGLRGRALGARSVRVHLETPGRVSDFSLGDTFLDLNPTN